MWCRLEPPFGDAAANGETAAVSNVATVGNVAPFRDAAPFGAAVWCCCLATRQPMGKWQPLVM